MWHIFLLRSPLVECQCFPCISAIYTFANGCTIVKTFPYQEFQLKSPSNSVVKLITFHALPLHPSTRTLSMPGCHLIASRCPSHSCVLLHLKFCIHTNCLGSSLEKSKSLHASLGVK